ncbi:hypothetical protein SRHO_G00255390 [Serrasalmus rhombeus]
MQTAQITVFSPDISIQLKTHTLPRPVLVFSLCVRTLPRAVGVGPPVGMCQQCADAVSGSQERRVWQGLAGPRPTQTGLSEDKQWRDRKTDRGNRPNATNNVDIDSVEPGGRSEACLVCIAGVRVGFQACEQRSGEMPAPPPNTVHYNAPPHGVLHPNHSIIQTPDPLSLRSSENYASTDKLRLIFQREKRPGSFVPKPAGDHDPQNALIVSRRLLDLQCQSCSTQTAHVKFSVQFVRRRKGTGDAPQWHFFGAALRFLGLACSVTIALQRQTRNICTAPMAPFSSLTESINRVLLDDHWNPSPSPAHENKPL